MRYVSFENLSSAAMHLAGNLEISKVKISVAPRRYQDKPLNIPASNRCIHNNVLDEALDFVIEVCLISFTALYPTELEKACCFSLQNCSGPAVILSIQANQISCLMEWVLTLWCFFSFFGFLLFDNTYVQKKINRATIFRYFGKFFVFVACLEHSITLILPAFVS